MQIPAYLKMTIIASLIFGNVVSTFSAPLEWSQYTPVQKGPAGRKHHAIGYDRERHFLIVFGGLGANNTVLRDTWVLDIGAGRWYEAKNGNQPPARYGSVYGLHSGHLFVATGCNLTHCFDDVWSFNSGSFTWNNIPAEGPLRPKPRGHASGGNSLNGRYLIISGGISTNGEYMSDVFSFDLSQYRWHLIEAWRSTYDPSSPHPRAFQRGAVIGQSTLLTFGGCLKHGPCPSAHSWTFDRQISKWNKLNLCAKARSHAAMATISYNSAQYAVMYGGDTGGRQIIASKKYLGENELAIFDPKVNEWTVRIASGAKTPRSRVGAAFASDGKALYLFGGEVGGRFPNDVFILTGDPNSASAQCGDSFFTLISLHGLFMFLGFAILLQCGGALAQYAILITEPSLINWRYLHKVSQTLGLLFIFCAFICGIAIIPDGHYHFQSVHSVLGLFVFLLLLVQALLGFLSLHYHDLKNIISTLHFWTGVGLLLLAYINISLGLFLAVSPPVLWISWFVYVLLVCSVGCFVLAYDCGKERRLLARIVVPEMERVDSDMVQPHRVAHMT